MSKVQVALVAMEAGKVVRSSDTLEDRFRAAMKKASSHWMVVDPDLQFQGAVAAVYELASEEERERITAELAAMRFVSAMFAGVPVDFESAPVVENRIGLVDLWREVNPERAR